MESSAVCIVFVFHYLCLFGSVLVGWFGPNTVIQMPLGIGLWSDVSMYHYMHVSFLLIQSSFFFQLFQFR